MTTAELAAHYRDGRVVVGLFFATLLGLGLVVCRDFGVSQDEGISRRNGQVSLAYVISLLPVNAQETLLSRATLRTLRSWPALQSYQDRDYGVAFELSAALGELLSGLRNMRLIFIYRHVLTFLVCWGGVVAVYQLARRRFHGWRSGLLAALVIVLSPRLFADFFYNSKDAVFMAFFAIGLNTMVRLVLEPTPRRAAIHALACAVAMDVRVMGVILPLATIGLIGIKSLRGNLPFRELCRVGLIYVGLLMAFIVAMWPFLWEAPLDNFVYAFRAMAHFRWRGTVLYRGQMILARELPWHYVPVWVGITTPPLYLLAFVGGALTIGRQVVRSRWLLYRSEEELQDLVFLTMAVAPVLSVIVVRSVLYDGWRQLYFVYPAFVLVSVRGLLAAWHFRPTKKWRVAVAGVLFAALLTTAGQMIRLHPFEHVYFNSFAGREHLERRYELDYWCLSCQRGLEWVVRHDDRRQIRVTFNMGKGSELNRLLLPAADQIRVIIEPDPDQADYLITNYRWHKRNYDYPHEVATILAGDLRILSVFDLR